MKLTLTVTLTAVCSSTYNDDTSPTRDVPACVTVTVSLHTKWSLQFSPVQTALTVPLPGCLAPIPQTWTRGSSHSAWLPCIMTSHNTLRHPRPAGSTWTHCRGHLDVNGRFQTGTLHAQFQDERHSHIFYWQPFPVTAIFWQEKNANFFNGCQ